jgi:hypothetical protein
MIDRENDIRRKEGRKVDMKRERKREVSPKPYHDFFARA